MAAPPPIEETWFSRRYASMAAARGWPADPQALLPAMTMADLRRLLLEVFSWGVVHQAAAHQRLEELALGDRLSTE